MTKKSLNYFLLPINFLNLNLNFKITLKKNGIEKEGKSLKPQFFARHYALNGKLSILILLLS